mgnify:CR=1 FL=1
MNRQISIRFGISAIALSVILLFLFNYFFPELVVLTRTYLTPDNHLNEVGVAKLRLALYFMTACIFLLGVVFAFNLINKLMERLPLQQWLSDIRRIFYHDPLCARKNMGKHFFLISSGVAILIHFLVLTFGRPEWEGSIDKHSPLLYLVAAILLLVSFAPLRKLELSSKVRKKIKRGLILVAVFFVAIYGEEVNWGQQYFEIETGGLFKLNYQQENSLHNFFNPIFYHVYSFVGFASFIILSYFWFVNKSKGLIINLFVPPVGFYVLFLIMAGSTYATELYELYFAVLSVLYATRIFLCLRHPGEVFFEEAGDSQESIN